LQYFSAEQIAITFDHCQQIKDVIPALLSREFEVEIFGVTLEGMWVSFTDVQALLAATKVAGI